MFYSPLRYPGGKGKLAPSIEKLIDQYGHRGGTYIEPFAGGAAVAIELLKREVVSEIVINDLDKGVYSFWRAILEDTEKFIKQIKTVPLNIDEWKHQRDICFNQNKKYSFDLGFATFYMNRTNRSGIIKGGVIGGQNQRGKWKLDARFNRENLIERIEKIAKLKSKIHLYNKDIESFILNYIPRFSNNSFIYFDPPYFNKGKQLYLNFFSHRDHFKIAKLIKENVKSDWIITYDKEPKISEIYKEYNVHSYNLNYSVSKKRIGDEIIILKREIWCFNGNYA